MLKASIVFFCLGLLVSAHAETTVSEKVSVAANDTKRAVKKTYRKVKDETCTLTKGKMECAADRVKHSVQNAVE